MQNAQALKEREEVVRKQCEELENKNKHQWLVVYQRKSNIIMID